MTRVNFVVVKASGFMMELKSSEGGYRAIVHLFFLQNNHAYQTHPYWHLTALIRPDGTQIELKPQTTATGSLASITELANELIEAKKN